MYTARQVIKLFIMSRPGMDKPAKRLTQERKFRIRLPIGAIFTTKISSKGKQQLGRSRARPNISARVRKFPVPKLWRLFIENKTNEFFK